MKECFPSAQAVHFHPSPPAIRGVSVMFPTHACCFCPLHYHALPPESSANVPTSKLIRIGLPCCSRVLFFLRLIFLMIGCSTPENNSTLVWHSFSTPLPPTSPAPSPPQWAAPHVPRCPLCQPLHQGRIWGLGAVERLLSQVDSQIAAVAFDGEKWAGQVSDGSPAGRQAHRLALIKKAPLLCSHRRWM